MPHDLLATLLRVRLGDDLASIAVIGPDAPAISAALRGAGYQRIWQRESPDAVLSLYQPERLFDAIVLTGSLEHLEDPACPEQSRRAFDQIEASLAADPGVLCVFVPASACTAKGLIDLLAARGYSMYIVETATPGDPEPRIVGVFNRTEGRGRR